MYDQLGKLARVNYTQYESEVEKGLLKMGHSGAESKSLARVLITQKPNFLLIIDSQLDEMVERARERGFPTLVVNTYRNSSGQIRLCLENETVLTKEPIPNIEPTEIIDCRVNKKAKNYVSNGQYWHLLDSKSELAKHNKITIEDRRGSFVANVEKLASSVYVNFPYEQKSIKDIVKGNRIGKLYQETGSNFRLILDW